MLRTVTDVTGKTVNLDCDVYLNGEIQYGEQEYDGILWIAVEGEEGYTKCDSLKDKKILVVNERKFSMALKLKELGYGSI